MQATPEQIEALLQLQEIDRKILAAEKQLEQLPQRAAIMDVRAKKEELAKKAFSLKQMHDGISATVQQLLTEDGQQAEKQTATQKQIDEAQGDYRNVSSLTRDLGGIAKRRETLAKKMSDATAELERVEAVQNQARGIASSLDSQETELIESFKKDGGALRAAIAQASALRDAAADRVGAQLLDTYDKTASKCGGVAVGTLLETSCSVCRNAIAPNKALELRHQGPVTTCPSCGRMLVVE